MAGLIDLSRKGYFKKGRNVLFMHTGGTMVLPVYQDYLLAHQTNIPVLKKGLS
ncbi:MAG: hypothetical protein J7M20_04660 [Deltaproteobacteria bacterium]|nr:hypothetical protein [Deltaproteobacteria bacterium]